MARAYLPTLEGIPIRRYAEGKISVITLDETGEIELDHIPMYADVPMIIPLPRYVKLPIPNNEAYELVHSTLLEETFYWKWIRAETVEYNIFLDADGNNITYDLYMTIVGMLKDPIGLPEVNHTGTCRISPIYYTKPIYVQPQPAYVDSVQYVIYLSMKDKISRNIIEPAQDIVIGKTYIYAEGRENYRVLLLERIVMPEHECFQEVMKTRAGRERATIGSTRFSPRNDVGNPSDSSGSSKDTICGKRYESDEEAECGIFNWNESDPFDRMFGEEVEVFCIDYGGPPMEVPRAHLYTVEDVCPELNSIPALAFPVSIGYVNGSAVDKNVRVEELRDRKQIIDIHAVFGATEFFPKIVNIIYETEC